MAGETIYHLVDELTNENEAIVMDFVNQLQQEKRLSCDCRECLLDITAMALNAIKPRYSVSLLKNMHDTPEELTLREQQIQTAILNACNVVKARPHHPPEL